MKRVVIPMNLQTASLFALLLVVLMSVCIGILHSQESEVTAGSQGRSAQTTSFHMAEIFSLTAPLQRAPQGTLTLFWLKARGILTVHIQATELAPNSLHPAIAHRGSCTNQVVQTLYTLTPLWADSLGDGVSFSTLHHIQGLPSSGGWSIDIYNGPNAPGSPDADKFQVMPLGCMDVSTLEDSLGDQLVLSRPLIAPWSGGQPVPDQAVSGKATFTASINGNLGANGSLPISISKIVLSMRGLVSDSIHIAHLHVSSCQASGNMLVSLVPVTADAAGVGTSTTVFSPPLQVRDLLYLTVYEAAAPSGFTTQQGFDLLVCGNLPKL